MDIRDGQIRSVDVADASLADVDLDPSALQRLEGPQGPQGPQGDEGPQGPPGPSTGPAGGDLEGSYPNPSVDENDVNLGGTGGGDISGSLLVPNIRAGAVGSSEIENGSVTAGDLSGAVAPQSVHTSGTPSGGTVADPAATFNGRTLEARCTNTSGTTELSLAVPGDTSMNVVGAQENSAGTDTLVHIPNSGNALLVQSSSGLSQGTFTVGWRELTSLWYVSLTLTVLVLDSPSGTTGTCVVHGSAYNAAA